MKKINLVMLSLLCAVILFSGCKKNSDSSNPTTPNPNNNVYTQAKISSLPGNSRDIAVAFAINGVGYVGLGQKNNSVFGDFYKYDVTSNSWSNVPTFGGVARRGAIQFVLNGEAYVGLGYGNNGSWNDLGDIWRFTPSTSTWTKMNDAPVMFKGEELTAFVVNGEAYILNSYGSLIKYNASNDSWTPKASMPSGAERSSAACFVVGSKAYISTGYVSTSVRLKDTWEYNPATDTWTQKADLPGGGRSGAIGFSLGNYGFVGTGTTFTSQYSDMYRYDPSANTWTAVDNFMGGAVHGMCGFVINSTFYMGTGYSNSKSYLSDFYSFK
ncbi:MAG: hypothetical protein IT247_05990 [Bacteroidia bacterium]|nr:hypothetical protein [Bacteroidia bacterium]